MTTLIEYHHFLIEDEAIKRFRQHIYDQGLTYIASDFFSQLGIQEVRDVEHAIRKAIVICQTLQIPIARHFKSFYRDADGFIIKDWRLSRLACGLALLNGKINHPTVAKMQLELIAQIL